MGSYSVLSKTDTTITLYITGVSVGDAIRVFARYYDDTSSEVHNNSHTATASSYQYVISGLTPGTRYAVNVGSKSSVSSDTTTWWGGTDVTTEERSRPEDWSWTSTVQAGAAMPIVQVGDMTYEVMPLTANEWNGFTARINEFRVYTGLSEYSFTTVYAGGSLLASQLNQARTAISGISGHGTLPAATSSGSVPKASFINGLKDALNAIP